MSQFIFALFPWLSPYLSISHDVHIFLPVDFRIKWDPSVTLTSLSTLVFDPGMDSPVHEFAILDDLVYSEIMTYLSSADICQLAKASSPVRAAVGRGISRIFNFHYLLSPFFDDTSSFRTLQKQTGAIIGGPVALQFFARTRFPDPALELPHVVLDVYVAFQARRHICDWFIQQGYRFKPRGPSHHPVTGALCDAGQPTDYTAALDTMHVFDDSDDYEPVEGVICMLDLARTVDGAYRRVRVHVVQENPLIAILNTHSSKLSPLLLTSPVLIVS